MIEFIVLIILIIAFIFLAYPIVTVPTFLINVSLFIIIALRARIDLKENKMHAYYLTAAFLAAVIFAANDVYGFMNGIFDFLFDNMILIYTQAVILIFILAHLIGFSNSTIRGFLHDLRKPKKTKKSKS